MTARVWFEQLEGYSCQYQSGKACESDSGKCAFKLVLIGLEATQAQVHRVLPLCCLLRG